MTLADTPKDSAPRERGPGNGATIDPRRRLRDTSFDVLFATLFAFAIVGALYVARDVLIPFALAALLSFLLAPPVRLLRRMGLPQGAAVTLVMLGTLVTGAAVGFLISQQAQGLARDFPSYEGHVREKLRAFKSWQSSGGFLETARETVSDLARELAEPVRPREGAPASPPPVLSGEKPGPEPPKSEATPQPAQGGEAASQPLTIEGLLAFAEPAFKPIADAALVALFTVFILLQREDLRNRFIRLLGAGDLNRTTVAMTDAAARLSRFFLLQASLNAAFGAFVAVALWWLEVPAALGFGVFAALMRFVPYIGSVLAALPPIAVAAAVEPGWGAALSVAAVFGLGEPIMGQVIEPLVYGRHTGLSPIAVVGAATFWTWLWGPIGLLLATPLTLCLVVLGQHTRPLGFLTVMLSDEPALSPPEVFYQRLLAGDAAELAWMSETALKSQSLVAYYDQVVLPGLRLAMVDERAGNLDEDRVQDIAAALDDLVETLGEADLGAGHDDGSETGGHVSHEAWRERFAALSPEGLPPTWREPACVVVYPARGMLDFASARMTADTLQKMGFGAETRARDRAMQAPDEMVARPLLEFLVTVGGVSSREMRLALRRIRRARPDSAVIAAEFASAVSGEAADRPLTSMAELLDVALSRAGAAHPAALQDGHAQASPHEAKPSVSPAKQLLSFTKA